MNLLREATRSLSGTNGLFDSGCGCGVGVAADVVATVKHHLFWLLDVVVAVLPLLQMKRITRVS